MRWVKQTVGYWCDDTVTGKYCGKNICTAVLDTGISVHPDLRDRIVGFRDFINDSSGCYDDSGHGTHVAGIMAGNGLASAGSYAGMAPDAELLIGKVLDRDGNGDVDHILRGMEWVMSEKARFRIRIVNISVGTQPELADGQKARLLKAVEDLWDAGLTRSRLGGKLRAGTRICCRPGNQQEGYHGRSARSAGAPRAVQEKN